jgi:hypothetical protein
MKVRELKKIFEASKLTQTAFAMAYNISMSTLSRYLRELDDDAYLSRQIEFTIKKQMGVLPPNATVDDLPLRQRPSDVALRTARFRERYLEIYGKKGC